jgi:cell division septation protein DedD
MLLMNTNFRAGYLAVMLLCISSALFAQKSTVTELLTRADRQFDLYAYNLAIQTYEQVLQEEKSNAHALARIGDCHYQLNNPDRAVEWYQKAQNTYKMEADVPLRLGKALMQTGDYDAARDQFLLYAEIDEKVGRQFASVADYAIKNAKKESQWQVKNEAINTSSADYGPAFYNNRVAFNSARTDIVPTSKTSAEPQGGNTNYLFVSERNPQTELLNRPVFLRSDVQNVRNEGPVSFSSNGRRVAFCRNKFISGTRQIAETGMNMSIYIADVENGTWKNVKAFPFNGSTFATGFPCLSPDGNKLIFASTQPGGFGGWDIYVSNFTATGWTEPRNLGTPLNSPGNEVTPFFDGEDLYFSSDWHKGFGGLDVFRASLGREEITEIFHLGPGINSPRDDYGFIYNTYENIGYLTSTRSGGRGNEDIWMVSKKWNDQAFSDRSGNPAAPATRDAALRPTEYSTPADLNYTTPNTATDRNNVRLHLLVTDERGFPLTDAEVDLSDCYGAKGFTAGDGKFYFDELLRPIDCNVSVRKRGYRDATIALRDFGKQNIKITLSNDVREEFIGFVFDAQTLAPIRGVTVQLQLADSEIETTTDEAGFYSLNVEPGLTYLITYNKYGYTDAVVRTNFPYNSNHRIATVNLEKTYDDRSVPPRRPDEYKTYDNTAKPITYNDVNAVNPVVTKVSPRETAKSPISADKFNGYSIQLAAMPEVPSEARLASYDALTTLGNLYVKAEGKMNKIRLGIYPTQAEANANLKKVLLDKKNKGAWVVEERGADETLIIGNEMTVAPIQYNAIAPVSRGNETGVRYGIQLGSFAAGKSISISDYTRLDGLGNLYSKSENGYTKVRLGVWSNYSQAEGAKSEAIRRGFPDAVIITERADDLEIKDYLISTNSSPNTLAPKGNNFIPNSPAPAQVEYSTSVTNTHPFLVRIAALSRPELFDVWRLEHLGSIHQRSAPNSPGMTVLLLGAYENMEIANKVANKLVDMGYEDAYVVKEENGKLIRK